MSSIASITLILILLGRPTGSQTVVPVGVQGQVNTYTTSTQSHPAVGVDDEGNFVVVWQSNGSNGDDGSGYSIQGRIYTSNGLPVGSQAQVNTYTTDRQMSPAVAVDTDGDFVVVWESGGSDDDDSSGYSIQGQRYGSNGQTVDGEFQVNSYTSFDQTSPAVAIDTNGGFIVVWQSRGSSGDDVGSVSIQGQRYSSDGSPAGGEFQVNSYTTGDQRFPAVRMNTDGAFVVVWDSDGSDGSDNSGRSIQGRIFTSNGAPIGPQAQVNTYTTDGQSDPAVGVDDEGNFVVVWESWGSGGSDDSGSSIQGRIYTSIGVPIGPQAQVNTYTTNWQSSPAVRVGADGDFFVVWDSRGSRGSDSSYHSIQGRIYASNALPAGIQFQINSYTTSYQRSPAVGVDDQGDFVVVWQSLGSSGSDTSGYSIQGQFFAVPLIFADGFESGDMTVWSSSVP